MGLKFSSPTQDRFLDNTPQERVRANVDLRILELQNSALASAAGSTVPGTLIDVLKMVTVGAFSARLPDGTTRLYVKMVGGGGGAGGVGNGAGSCTSGGGGSGRYLEFLLDISDLNISGSVGAAGIGGGSGGGTGGNGGDTSFKLNGVTWLAKGGMGSIGVVGAATTIGPGGGELSGSSFPAGAISCVGYGVHGINVGGLLYAGHGGSSPMGTGGYGTVALGTSTGGSGYGWGGGGALGSTANPAAGETGGSGGIYLFCYRS